MRKELGFSAGLVALLAVIFHVVQAPPSEKTPAGDAKTPLAEQSAKSAERSGPEEPGEQANIEGPWLATQAFFHEEPKGRVCLEENAAGSSRNANCRSIDFSKIADLENCSAREGCRAQLAAYFAITNYHRQFLIATVPDPRHTRLSLFTDSSIEAIGQAAYDSYWEFATQWLPWYDAANPDEKNPEARRKQRFERRRQEKQPGLLIFRHSPVESSGPAPSKDGGQAQSRKSFDAEMLFVFLVGETPTAGINGSQFRAARAYMRAFDDPSDVRIAGPTFSGSFYSLTQLINSDRASGSDVATGRTNAYKYSVLTGTATNARAAQAFQAETGAFFHSTGANADDQDRHFTEILGRLGIPANEAAVLVEDESGFSKGYSKRWQPKYHVLRFPREISHLRNVYRGATAASQSPNSAPEQVEFSLKDAESGEDSVPVFSSTQTPLSQNAVIGEIMNEIRRDRIRMVELAATNVLDSLFLAQVLRRQCPDTRLLVTSPDLLFVQEARTESLAGTLALSPYPLFFSSKQWFGEHPVHTSANAQGLYNAIQLFLLPDKLSLLSDYSWLITLTRQGFSPVKLWRNAQDTRFKEVTKPQFELPDPPIFWDLATAALALASFLICGRILYLETNTQVLSWSIPAPDGDHIADAYRLVYLICALLTLAAMQAVLYIPFAANYIPSMWQRLNQGRSPHIFALAGTLVPIAVSIWLPWKVFQKPRNTPTRVVYIALIFLAFSGFLSAWSFCCLRADDSRAGFFFSFRALELQMGSSPALPILVFLLGLFVFSLSHVIRFYFAVNQRPRMFTAVFDRFLQGRMRKCRRDLNRALVAPMNFTARRQVIIIAATFAGTGTFGLLCRADVHLASLEGAAYNGLVLILSALLALSVIAATIQVQLSWTALQPLLTRLNLLPIGSAFTKLRDAGRNGPIWARRLNLQSLDIPTRSSIVLHNLKILLERQQPGGCDIHYSELHTWLQEYWLTLSALIGEQQSGATPHTPAGTSKPQPMDRATQRYKFMRLRYLGASISHELGERILLPEWRERRLPWNAAVSSSESEEAGRQMETSQQDGYGLAQAFVALQYSMFINYGVRQIQNLTLTVSLGFGLLVVALNVYSFQSPQAIGRFLLVAFVLLGYVMWKIMSQMERDPILSRLSGSTGGELNKEFYMKLIGYGALPVLSILTSQFPSIGVFLTSWVQPSLEAFK